MLQHRGSSAPGYRRRINAIVLSGDGYAIAGIAICMMRRDHSVFAFEPLPFDESVFDHRQLLFIQQIEKLLFVCNLAEIDGGQIIELGFDQLDNPSFFLEQCLKEDDLTVGFQPGMDAIEDQSLILEKHEAHAEQDKIEKALRGRLVSFDRDIENFDAIFKMVLLDKSIALIQIGFVDIDPDDVKRLLADQPVVILHHDPVADAYIQNGGLRGKIGQAILVTRVCNAVEDQCINLVSH